MAGREEGRRSECESEGGNGDYMVGASNSGRAGQGMKYRREKERKTGI